MRAVLERDFVAFARSPRSFLMRALVVASPLIFLPFVTGRAWLSPDEVGRQLFTICAWCLIVALILATPALFGHLLTEEKRNNKLDVLRSTPLSARSIVLGKWLSRLGHMVTVIAAAAPLMAASLLYGGVAPFQLVQTLALCFATVVFLSAVSLLVSARHRDLGSAMRAAYTTSFGLLLLTSLGIWTTTMFAFRSSMAGSGSGVSEPWVWVRTAAMILNPFAVMSEIVDPAGGGGGSLPVAIGGSLPWIAIVTLCVLGLALLPLALRAFLQEHLVGKKRRPAAKATTARTEAGEAATLEGDATTVPEVATPVIPEVVEPAGRQGGGGLRARAPLVWIERQQGRRASRVGVVFFFLLFAAVEFSFFASFLWSRDFSDVSPATHILPCAVAFAMAALTMAATGAASFHRDDEAKTLEVLRSTPLTNVEFLGAKRAATLYSALPWLILLFLHLMFGLLVGDLGFLPTLVCMGVVAVLFLALTGLALVVSLTAKKASVATVRMMGIIALHTLLWPVIAGLLASGANGESGIGVLLGHHPAMMTLAPFIVAEEPEALEIFVWSFVYLGVYVIMACRIFAHTLPRLYARQRIDPTHPKWEWFEQEDRAFHAPEPVSPLS